MILSPELVNRIRSNAMRWIESPTLPQDIIELLFTEGLFKLFVPRCFGGKEFTLSQATRCYAEVATADGSVAWLVQIGAGGGFFVPSFSPAVAERIYAPVDAVIAGSGYATGKARNVPGGYRVTGQWKYASGAQYARVFTANAVLEGDNTIRAFAFDRQQVSLIEDWQSFGMRATSSWTFRVADVFVPEELSFVVGEKVWEPGIAVYNVPFLLFAIASFGAVAIGLARALFDEAIAAVAPMAAPGRLRNLELVRSAVEGIEVDFFRLVREIEQPEVGPSADCSRYHAALSGVIQRLYDTVWRALPWCGMQLIMENTRLNRIVRDFLVIRQHELLRPLIVEVPGVEPGSEAPVA